MKTLTTILALASCALLISCDKCLNQLNLQLQIAAEHQRDIQTGCEMGYIDTSDVSFAAGVVYGLQIAKECCEN